MARMTAESIDPTYGPPRDLSGPPVSIGGRREDDPRAPAGRTESDRMPDLIPPGPQPPGESPPNPYDPAARRRAADLNQGSRRRRFSTCPARRVFYLEHRRDRFARRYGTTADERVRWRAAGRDRDDSERAS